jgi:hypothetical protein
MDIFETEIKDLSKTDLYKALVEAHEARRLAFMAYLESNDNVETIVKKIREMN